MKLEKLAELFENPRLITGEALWSWNGKLSKEELLRQADIIQEMGFGGFFMHSRTGLSTQYMGEEWLELINACADEAEKLGLEAWLYDEDRWPSGTAGGMVTENPEYRMQSVQLSVVKPEEFSWSDDLLAAFSCRLEGASYYNCSRIQEKPERAFPGMYILVFKVVTMAENSFYNGNTYLDTMNKKATERFIELTHEKYKKSCGTRLGKSIRGIFTDEPHRGTLMDFFGAGNEKDNHRAPWTAALPEEFKAKYGCDLIEKLPELFLMPEGHEISATKWQYVELLEELFLKNFFQPIHEWCAENSISLTGHGLHEDSLTAQTAMVGSIMRIYEYMDNPGVDVLAEGNRSFWIVKQLSSAARQLGKKDLLSELYGCTGWQMNFESHKAVGDWQALFGINQRCHHLAWYTMEGEAKRDFPGSIFFQSAWYRDYKYVEDYFSRVNVLMGLGKPCCNVLVLNPVESVWCMVRPGWANMLSADMDVIKQIEENYQTLFTWLCMDRIDFDYGDEDILARYAHVEADQVGKPQLTVGDCQYNLVIVTGMVTIRSSTVALLDNFLKAGGSVLFAGASPSLVDAQPCTDAAQLPGTFVPFDRYEIAVQAEKHIDCKVSVTDSQGNPIDDVYCQVRKENENYVIMLLNVNREKSFEQAAVAWNISGFVCEWVCETGEKLEISSNYSDGFTHIITDFVPGGEHLYVVSKEKQNGAKSEHSVWKAGKTLKGPYPYTLSEPNVCVLDMVEYQIDGKGWSEQKEILKADREIRGAFGLPLRGGEMLQPWFVSKLKKQEKNYGTVQFRFTFEVKDLPQKPVELVCERPDLFQININGQTLDSNLVNGWWIDKCFNKIPVPAGYLHLGLNDIVLQTEFYESTNPESLYLLGEFGVSLHSGKSVLTCLPDKIPAGDITKLGFPFYSGTIRYFMENNLIPKEQERLAISFGKHEAACLKVTAADKSPVVIAWQPYRAEIGTEGEKIQQIAVDVVLTRRNTFGPLHQLPLCTPAYAPENFITEGEQFSNDYVLYPSGLLEEPQVEIFCMKPSI